MHTLSLIIPVYNSERVLPGTCKQLTDFFSTKTYLAEVLFVNDGSSDGTPALIKQFIGTAPFTVRLINHAKNAGKGAAVRTGVANVGESEYIFFSDDDIPFGLEPLEEMYQLLESDKSVDLATADRSLVEQHNPYPWHRRVGSYCYSMLLPRSVARKFPDMHGGLKGFRAPIARQIFHLIKNPRWSFDPEIFIIVLANKFNVGKIPVHFLGHVQGTHFRIKDFMTVAMEILKLRINSLCGRYTVRN